MSFSSAAKASTKHNQGAVSQTISLSDCFARDTDTTERYYFLSRCGSEFAIDAQQLETGDGEVFLQCVDCTERICVQYEAVEDIGGQTA